MKTGLEPDMSASLCVFRATLLLLLLLLLLVLLLLLLLLCIAESDPESVSDGCGPKLATRQSLLKWSSGLSS